MKMDLRNVGIRIKKRRTDLNLKQSNLAELTGISTGNLSEIESGKKLPSTPALLTISKALNCSTDWLLTGENYKESNDTLYNKQKNYLLELYESMSKTEQEELIAIAELKVKKEKKTEISSPSPRDSKNKVG